MKLSTAAAKRIVAHSGIPSDATSMYHLPLYYVQLRYLNIYRSKKQNGGEFPRLFFWLDLVLSTSP